MVTSIHYIGFFILGLTSCCHATSLVTCLEETRSIFNDLELSQLWYAALQETDHNSSEIVLLGGSTDADDVDDRINTIDWGENSTLNSNLLRYQAQCQALSGTYVQLDVSARCSHFDGSQDSFFEENNAPFCLGLACSGRNDFPWLIQQLTGDRWLSRTELLENFTFTDTIANLIPDPSWWCQSAGIFSGDLDISDQWLCASETIIVRENVLEAQLSETLDFNVKGVIDFTGVAATATPFEVTLDFSNTSSSFEGSCMLGGHNYFENKTITVQCTKSVDDVDTITALYSFQSWPRCVAASCNSSDFDLLQISELDMILRFKALVDDAFNPFSYFSNVNWRCYTTGILGATTITDTESTEADKCDEESLIDKTMCQITTLRLENPLYFWGIIAAAAFLLLCCCILLYCCCFSD
mmetsp:Transcript_23153/g.38282  ORF Transcript_23153/g.38282 Transcript_23153/m.38282 type:complete len:412 (+) Transcript_23153:119-1354(+)